LFIFNLSLDFDFPFFYILYFLLIYLFGFTTLLILVSPFYLHYCFYCFYCFYCLVIVYDEFHLPRLYPLCPPSFLELRLFPSTDFTTTDGPNLVGPLTPIPLYIIIPAQIGRASCRDSVHIQRLRVSVV